MKQIIVIYYGNDRKHERLFSTLEYERHIIAFFNTGITENINNRCLLRKSYETYLSMFTLANININKRSRNIIAVYPGNYTKHK
jgi:hypothetical protein